MFDEAWPLFLLAMRLGVAAALYLFLLVAFNTIRRELGARSQSAATPAVDVARTTSATGAVDYEYDPAVHKEEPYLDEPFDDEIEEVEDWEPDVPAAATAAIPASDALPARTRRLARHRDRSRATRWSVLVPVAGGVLAIALAAGGVFATRAPDEQPGVAPPAGTDQPFGPPTQTPAAGQVTVGLAATEDSNVRITVDGVVEFDGVLKAGDRQAWNGVERIQVWTDKGKTIELSVNGVDLGPYSPAMGHPDWNRIDYGFFPGWPG